MTEQPNLTLQRTRNPWGQGEKLRTEILAASARLLSELGGEEALTIRGVARAVGIAPASIYQHFADKAALVAGLLDYDYQRLAQDMRGAHDAVPAQDPVGRLRAQMRAYCRFAIDNPGHYRLMLNNRHAGHRPSAGDRGPLADLATLVILAFEECEAAGYRLRVPARKAAIMVFVGAHGRVALWHSSPDEAGAEEIVPFVDELISLVFADSVD
ncbi:MAG TPA: TetR/AcrR family transcriptional regulator [Pseudonocardiaceae bacterium]|nr:TetR/AcrR family transcriptional regulator [Pseudonocardiaceae bacterium]